jgi:hypothetical protein
MIHSLKENLLVAFKVWFILSLIVPITGTILNILFNGILGSDIIKYDFLTFLKMCWVDWYFTGIPSGVVAWRAHLGAIFVIFLISVGDDLLDEY